VGPPALPLLFKEDLTLMNENPAKSKQERLREIEYRTMEICVVIHMKKLSVKEKIFYGLILNDKRVYKYWYTRFLICGVSLDRIRKVVSRINKFNVWCNEWSKEGEKLEKLAHDALNKGNFHSARCLFHEAAGCFHIGQHFFFLDIRQKNKAQDKARENYQKAIKLYNEKERPIRIEIPFRGTVIPGYLRLANQANKPLVIFINGLDNLKEIENHYWGNEIVKAGYNFFTFDGPGQGEMWKNMKMIPDYEKVISTIIDWFNKNNDFKIDLNKIGTIGFSFGGYLSPRVASFDKRIACAVGFGGLGYLREDHKLIPLIEHDFLHVTGFEHIREVIIKSKVDIQNAPPLDRPLLFIQGGTDRIIPEPKKQAYYIKNWAVGNTELKYYPDGDHCCANYLDELLPYTIDWLNRHLMKSRKSNVK